MSPCISCASMRPATPPRLASFDYVGLQRYFLTICTERRKPIFVSSATVDSATQPLIGPATSRGFSISAYCFMPDHVHALIVGIRHDAAFEPFVKVFKQTTSFDFRRGHSGRLWQAGYYDRVLRSDGASLQVTRYILENPVRAGFDPEVPGLPV